MRGFIFPRFLSLQFQVGALATLAAASALLFLRSVCAATCVLCSLLKTLKAMRASFPLQKQADVAHPYAHAPAPGRDAAEGRQPPLAAVFAVSPERRQQAARLRRLGRRRGRSADWLRRQRPPAPVQSRRSAALPEQPAQFRRLGRTMTALLKRVLGAPQCGYLWGQ